MTQLNVMQEGSVYVKHCAIPLVLTLPLDEYTPPLPTFLVLLDLRQYYEKSSLAIFLTFVYLSSTLWGTPTTKVHDPVPWSDTIKCHAKR